MSNPDSVECLHENNQQTIIYTIGSLFISVVLTILCGALLKSIALRRNKFVDIVQIEASFRKVGRNLMT